MEARDLPTFAAEVAAALREHFDPATLPVQQVLGLAEEAGEFVGAYSRWAGMARRTGTWADVCAELADVVLCAYVAAEVLGIDLDRAWRAKAAVVVSRGWRERPAESWPCASPAACRRGPDPHERSPECDGPWLERLREPGECAGCVGRGTGERCCICGGVIPAVLQRSPGAPSEIGTAR